MGKLINGSYLYYVAGVMLILAYLLLWFLDNPACIEELLYAGWMILAVGLVLIFLPMFVFRSKGKVKKENDWTKTSVLVDTGIYSVVRHPLYLGWLLMYLAIIFCSQHWLTTIIGITGMACVYSISRQEDGRLVVKFGDAYTRYMQSVPGINILVGLMRLLRRRNND
ncbi:MAG: isoprenylcysteine carboxylmethyltransferase family protein [Desulfobacteraceae bacterium]|nr:isoprenylcysteine carboxylmethyltransferase family protein [Desulfobacteraceae bacterium]MBC2720930.1 isoprenylcysteine carboxylmethyltransferase family protein [Desulfobacteraceae bacterium]